MEELLQLPVVLTLATLLVLIVALLGCTQCFRSLFPKPDELAIVNQDESGIEHNDNLFGDFTPPSQNTPYNDPVHVDPLPDISHLRLDQHVSSLAPVLTGPSLAQENIKLLNDPSMQFPRTQLSYVDELGSGWFGKVLLGDARKIQVGIKKTKVVVQELRDTASRDEQIRFLTDVQSHRELRHPNMLTLLGQCIDTIPFLLIMEHAPLGDLKSYLMKHRDDRQSLALRDAQLRWACDLASGLTLMHQAGFILKDLATRNCLVASSDSLKIGDYGLSQETYKEDYYMLPSENQLVPIRWLPPDSFDVKGSLVKPKPITKESNVWSFGIVLWELSTGALLPYINCNDEEVVKEVIIDQRTKLEMPELQVKYIGRWWEIMQLCWQSYDNRPSMQHILELLNHLKSHKDKSDREEFQEKWDALKRSGLMSNGSPLFHLEASEQPLSNSEQPLSNSEQLTPAVIPDTGFAAGNMMNPALTNPLTSSVVMVEHHHHLSSPDAVTNSELAPSPVVSQNELIDVSILNEQKPLSMDLLTSNIAYPVDLLKTPPNTPIEEGYLSKMSEYDDLKSSEAAQFLAQGLETLDSSQVGLPQSLEHVGALASIQQLNAISASNFTSLSPLGANVNGMTSPSGGTTSPADAGDTKVLDISNGNGNDTGINGKAGDGVEEDESLLLDDVSEDLLDDGRPRKSSIRHSNSKPLEDGAFKSVTFEDDPSLTSVYSYLTEPTSPSNPPRPDAITANAASDVDDSNGEKVTESPERSDDIEMLVQERIADELESLVEVKKENTDNRIEIGASVPEETLPASGNGDANGVDSLFGVSTDWIVSKNK